MTLKKNISRLKKGTERRQTNGVTEGKAQLGATAPTQAFSTHLWSGLWPLKLSKSRFLLL